MKRTWRPDWPLDLDLVLGPLLHGRNDPSARRTARQQWWLAGRTDAGAATLHVQREAGDIVAAAWGEGGAALLDRLPHLLGDDDDPAGFRPQSGTVIEAQWRRHGSHWRVPATGFVWESAVVAVLEQKVTGLQARRGWYRLCLEHGSRAPGPGPADLCLAPTREALAGISSWWWRDAGVEHARAGTLQRLARTLLADEPVERLRRVPGIGPWTLAEVSFRALGDADAVSVGDFHLANLVGFALTGRPRSTDEQMLELLAPYQGHRYRAVRMIELSGTAPPKFGPRMPLLLQPVRIDRLG